MVLQKKFKCIKTFCPKKILGPDILDQNFFEFQQILGQKSFCQILGLKKNLCQDIWNPKNFGSEKKIGSRKILGRRTILTLKNVQKNLGKRFWG